MECFVVEGGHPLEGSITPQGAKNEALQVLCATLLTRDTVYLENVPRIQDVRYLLDLLQHLGVRIGEEGAHSYALCAEKIDDATCKEAAFVSKARALRGSIMLMGPLLARKGHAYLPRPGGDKVGLRPVDTHIKALMALGARFSYDRQEEYYTLEADTLKGTCITLEEASVTGTANLVMAAVLADGHTHIYHAACEPYVQQLCHMLNRMGAKITGIGSNKLSIEGVQELHGTRHRLLSDMIEVGSLIGLAALTQSEITIKNADVQHLGALPRMFEGLGIDMEYRENDVYVPLQKDYTAQRFIDGSLLRLYDSTWPGLSPDMISIGIVVATQAIGSVLFHQRMFESRLFFVDKLVQMGARIILCDPHRVTVIGLERKQPLYGIRMSSPDIRAGVALLLAALSAQGTSTIENIEQIDRGYEAIETRLCALGARIKRVGAQEKA